MALVAPQMETQKTNSIMRTGRELILATKPYTKEDRTKSWMLLVSTLLLLATALAGAFFIPYVIPRLVCSLLAGLLMVRMFIIFHDFQHHAILHRSVLADVIMTTYGWYVLVPSSIWKRSHDYHHAHNSKLFSASIGSYPIATKEKFLSMTKSERRMYLFIRHPFTIIMGYFTMFIIGMCISSFISAPKKHYDSLIALVLHGLLNWFIFTTFGWETWLFFVFIPIFLASAMGAYLFYAQHNFPDTKFCDKEDWKYEMAALESSSYMVMNPFMQFMTGNIGFHHIHHLNSRIPFYRLPEVYKDFPELQDARTTSLKPKDIIACFRLKVWDPEANKMIGFKELNAVN